MGNAVAGHQGSGSEAGGGSGGGGAFDTASSYRDADPASFLPAGGDPVYVNVYHLMPLGPAGMLNGAVAGIGVFHSGVQIGSSTEWAFGGDPSNPQRSGVFPHPPRAILPTPQFHRSHHVGNLPKNANRDAVQRAINAMAAEPGWACGSYQLLGRNCNHFAEALVRRLSELFVEPAGGPPMVYPSYINRAARLGTNLIPPQMLAAFGRAAPQAPSATTGHSQPAQNQAPPRQQPPPPQQQQQSASGSSKPESSRRAPKPATQANRPPARAYPREELEAMPAKELRRVATELAIPTAGLLEREDFIDAIARASAPSGRP